MMILKMIIFTGQTAFFKAAKDGNFDKCKFLVSLGSNVKIPDKQGSNIHSLISLSYLLVMNSNLANI